MKQIHEALSLLLNAPSHIKDNVKLEVSGIVKSITLCHFNKEGYVIKTIQSYYEGDLSTYDGNDGYTYPFEKFTGEVEKYIKSIS